MTLNERLLHLVAEHVPKEYSMYVVMVSGNLLSIPEEELRTNLEKYLKVMQEVLDGG